MYNDCSLNSVCRGPTRSVQTSVAGPLLQLASSVVYCSLQTILLQGVCPRIPFSVPGFRVRGPLGPVTNPMCLGRRHIVVCAPTELGVPRFFGARDGKAQVNLPFSHSLHMAFRLGPLTRVNGTQLALVGGWGFVKIWDPIHYTWNGGIWWILNSPHAHDVVASTNRQT